MTRHRTLAASVLALAMSYAALWFADLAGQPARIAALALMVAGLALVLLDLIAPTECACGCRPGPAVDPEDGKIESGPLTAELTFGVTTPTLADEDAWLRNHARTMGYVDLDDEPQVVSFTEQPLDDVDIAPAYEPAARHRAERS